MKGQFFKLTMCIVISTLVSSCKNETPKDYLEKDINEVNIDKSIDYCSKAIELDSNYIEAYYRRASLYISLARGIQTMIETGSQDKGNDLIYFKKGIEDYNKILLIDSKEVNAQALKGFAYLYQGDTITACIELNKASLLGDKDASKKSKEVCN